MTRPAILGGGIAIVLVAAAALVLRAGQRAEAARAAMRDSFIEQALLLPRGSRESVRMAMKGLSSPPTPKEMRVLTTLTHAARRFAEEVVVEADDVVDDATWSADGKRIAVIARDKTLRVHDGATGKELSKVEIDEPGEVVRWADDTIVVARRGGLRLFSGDGKRSLEHADSVPWEFVRITPDGHHVLFAGTQKAKLFTVTGAKLTSRDLAEREKTSSVVLSNSGELVARDGDVTNANGDEIFSFESPVVAFSPASTVVVVGERMGAVAWDVATRAKTWSMRSSGRNAVFTPDGARLFMADEAATFRSAPRAGEHQLWLSHAMRDYGVEPPKTTIVTVIAANGKRLAVNRVDGLCEIRDPETGDVLDVVAGVPLAFSPDGTRLLTKRGNEAVAWRIAGAGLAQHFPELEKLPEFREGIDYPAHTAPPRAHWVIDGNRAVRLEGFHAPKTDACHKEGASRCAVSGAWMATIDDKPVQGIEWRLRVWNGGDERAELPVMSHEPWAMELQISADGRYVFIDSPPTLLDVSWPAVQAAASRIVTTGP